LKSQLGKLALVPGGVGLGQAPPLAPGSEDEQLSASGTEDKQVVALYVDQDHVTEIWAFKKVGIGTTDPSVALDVNGQGFFKSPYFPPVRGERTTTWTDKVGSGIQLLATTSGDMVDGFGTQFVFSIQDNAGIINNIAAVGAVRDGGDGTGALIMRAGGVGTADEKMRISASGNVGIGTTSPSATLEVHGSATNLLALYDPVAPTDPKFRVTKTGEVHADGAYYSGTGGFHTGSADVAERINTSEWVEPGNVVEIDPEHPGFFRKSTAAYSKKVAGIISTSPGVILGNDFDAPEDKWDDTRPVLAIAGRVPVKVTTENGPIEIGDLLVSSSMPGIAMKGTAEEALIGAVVGKAMELLEEGTGTVMAQVTLR